VYKVLVCTHHLHSWAGSELVSIEFAEELHRLGHKVEFYCGDIDEAFLKAALRFPVKVIQFAEEIDVLNYDIIYSHHQMPSRFISNQKAGWRSSTARPVFIYNHLSPFEPFEMPGPFIEKEIGDIILCNSAETKEELSGYVPFVSNAELFENPAPKIFDSDFRNTGTELTSILLISNHAPTEVIQALEILKNGGVKVNCIGSPEINRRVTPADIKSSDAVITIGKSTQYALRSRVPVFCYDHFGGPGWINNKNLQVSAEYNFSGRPERKIFTSQEMSSELVEGYANALAFCMSLKDKVIDRFSMEIQVAKLLDSVDRKRQEIKSSNGVSLYYSANAEADFNCSAVHEKRLYELVDRHYIGQRKYSTAYRKSSERVKRLREALEDSSK